MQELAELKGFNNKLVLEKSRELDNLLNEYQNLIKDEDI